VDSPRVLIVDDAEPFRCLLRQLLERRGYVIAGEAGCGARALELLERLDPDAVLVDVHLGEENGFAVAARLTQARPELPVLLTSADFHHHFYALADVVGARGFVPKEQLARVDLTVFWPWPAAPSLAARPAAG
jgi:DNA-binding NarL/FixJ family response regulator